tara:strand:+ start:1124 stop:1300 length:177 start_codon:yes stop_codon:yes gene_type:complete
LHDKIKVFKRIRKLEAALFLPINKFTDKELEERHDKGTLEHLLRALEKLKVEQSNDLK